MTKNINSSRINILTTKIFSNIRFVFIIALIITIGFSQCRTSKSTTDNNTIIDTIYTNVDGKGVKLELTFSKGKAHNHPLMAFWIEDTAGNYIQTLYVAESIAKGFFRFGDKSTGRWMPGPIRRPATLPYWAHKRGVKAEDGLFIPSQQSPIPDAYSGATPKSNFKIITQTDEKLSPSVISVLFEINQPWDWNMYWNNSKFPEDINYKTSCQPALIYKATIDLNNLRQEYQLTPIGHSHYSGKDGSITTDLSTITTALDISEQIRVKVIIE